MHDHVLIILITQPVLLTISFFQEGTNRGEPIGPNTMASPTTATTTTNYNTGTSNNVDTSTQQTTTTITPTAVTPATTADPTTTTSANSQRSSQQVPSSMDPTQQQYLAPVHHQTRLSTPLTLIPRPYPQPSQIQQQLIQ